MKVSWSEKLYCSFSRIWFFPNMCVHQTFSFQQLHITRKLPTHFLTVRRVSQSGHLKKRGKTQTVSHVMIHFTILNCLTRVLNVLWTLNRFLTSHWTTNMMSAGDINHPAHIHPVFSISSKNKAKRFGQHHSVKLTRIRYHAWQVDSDHVQLLFHTSPW